MGHTTSDVENEYSRNPGLKKEDVGALKQWLEKQPHLPEMNEQQLILFLHSCYYKIEAAKAAIDTFFTIRTLHPEVFFNRDPNFPGIRESMEVMLFAQIPKYTPEGYRVLFITFVDSNSSKFIMADQVKLLDMNIMLWLHEKGTAEGLVLAVDIKGLSLGHLTRMVISILRAFFIYLQDGLPVRLKGLHFINAGGVAEKFLVMCRPFIKSDLLEVLHLHADVSESFYKIVPQECLPRDYGGSMDSVSELHDLMKKKLLDNASYFIEDAKQKTDESKRQEKLTNFITDSYGLDGSFKKIELD